VSENIGTAYFEIRVDDSKLAAEMNSAAAVAEKQAAAANPTFEVQVDTREAVTAVGALGKKLGIDLVAEAKAVKVPLSALFKDTAVSVQFLTSELDQAKAAINGLSKADLKSLKSDIKRNVSDLQELGNTAKKTGKDVDGLGVDFKRASVAGNLFGNIVGDAAASLGPFGLALGQLTEYGSESLFEGLGNKTKGLTDKIDGLSGTSKTALAGVGALTAGLSGLGLASDDTSTKLVSVVGAAAGIGTAFATGGPVAGGIAIAATAAGFLVGELTKGGEEAKKVAAEAKGITEELLRAAEAGQTVFDGLDAAQVSAVDFVSDQFVEYDKTLKRAAISAEEFTRATFNEEARIAFNEKIDALQAEQQAIAVNIDSTYEQIEAANQYANNLQKVQDNLNAEADAQLKGADDASIAAAVRVAAQETVSAAVIVAGEDIRVYKDRVTEADLAMIEATQATNDFNDAIASLTGALDAEEAGIRLDQKFDDIREAAVKAYTEGGSAADDYRLDQIALNKATLTYLSTLEDVPAEKVTEISALIDQGDYDEAQRQLDALEKTRTAEFQITIKTVASAETKQLELRFNRDINGNGVIGAFAGADTTPGQRFVVNEIGQESFVPDNGGKPFLIKPGQTWAPFTAPSSGTIMNHIETEMLQKAGMFDRAPAAPVVAAAPNNDSRYQRQVLTLLQKLVNKTSDTVVNIIDDTRMARRQPMYRGSIR